MPIARGLKLLKVAKLALQGRQQDQEKKIAESIEQQQKTAATVKDWEDQITAMEAELKQKSDEIDKASRDMEQANTRLQAAILQRGPDVHTGTLLNQSITLLRLQVLPIHQLSNPSEALLPR